MTCRDVVAGDLPSKASAAPGRNRVAVIGIDRYRSWPVLNNAVRDAQGALRLFEYLGFELVGPPLLDDSATGAAIQGLATDELMALGPDDSLVVFFAGHGGTRSQWLGNEELKTGYLIPVDAAHGDRVATWIDLEDWLRKIARLPPKHILVLLDACFTGIALGSVAKWRGGAAPHDGAFGVLHGRRSRRIISSALDDQVAGDCGPVAGHSLFTGCLIDGFRHRQLGDGRRAVTGSELGLYLQRQVSSYPESHQTPDFGTFEHDDRGEMTIALPTEPFDPELAAARARRAVSLAMASVPDPTAKPDPPDPGAPDASTSDTAAPGIDARAPGLRGMGVRVPGRWIVAAVAVASLALVSSAALVASSVLEPSSAADPLAHAVHHGVVETIPTTGTAVSRAPIASIADGGAVVGDAPARSAGGDRASGSATAERPRPSPRVQPGAQSSSASSDRTRAVSRPVPGAAVKATIAPPAASPAIASARAEPARAVPEPSTAVPGADNAVPEAGAATTRRRAAGSRNRRVRSAVDEHDCAVKGTQDVDITSFPPGATIYLNHKRCGALGKTSWRGKLFPSNGTATGAFTAILEREGEPPVVQEFKVERSTRLQRIELRMPGTR